MTHGELMRRYLERLGLVAPPPPSWAGLKDLVSRHLQTVPFENLDVMAGLRPDLTTEGALRKLVIRQRGGFCYELNEAFGALLAHAGFGVRRIEARVWSVPKQQFGPPFDHLALVVKLPEGEFLTDVGFGDNNHMPMRLPEDSVADVSGRYTLAQVSADLWLLAREERPLYQLTLATQPLAAFVPMYRFHQTSPESIFSKGLICTRATLGGRITMSGDRLSLIEGANRTETTPEDPDLALDQYFGIVKEKPLC
jgi:N-hydroxyarylamine O-acetyltransferase